MWRVLLAAMVVSGALATEQILRRGSEITLRRNSFATTSRNNKNQLTCTGPLCAEHQVDELRCTMVDFINRRAHWDCFADLSPGISFDAVHVNLGSASRRGYLAEACTAQYTLTDKFDFTDLVQLSVGDVRMFRRGVLANRMGGERIHQLSRASGPGIELEELNCMITRFGDDGTPNWICTETPDGARVDRITCVRNTGTDKSKILRSSCVAQYSAHSEKVAAHLRVVVGSHVQASSHIHSHRFVHLLKGACPLGLTDTYCDVTGFRIDKCVLHFECRPLLVKRHSFTPSVSCAGNSQILGSPQSALISPQDCLAQCKNVRFVETREKPQKKPHEKTPKRPPSATKDDTSQDDAYAEMMKRRGVVHEAWYHALCNEIMGASRIPDPWDRILAFLGGACLFWVSYYPWLRKWKSQQRAPAAPAVVPSVLSSAADLDAQDAFALGATALGFSSWQATENVKEARLVMTRGFDGDPLAIDERVAVRLYTGRAHAPLNEALRNRDHKKLATLLPFLKLLVGALHKLEPECGTCYRGIATPKGRQYTKGERVTWHAFSSASRNVGITNRFFGSITQRLLGAPRTLFTIHSRRMLNIKRYSQCKDENEMVLLPGTRLVIKSVLRAGNGLVIVQMEEDVPGHRSHMIGFEFHTDELVDEKGADQNRAQSPDKRRECVVCMANEVEFVSIPCGHVTMCGTCLRTMEQRAARTRETVKCPMCRQYVTKSQKLFFS